MDRPEAWFLDVLPDQQTLSADICAVFISLERVIWKMTEKELACDNAKVSSTPTSAVHQKCCIPPL
jgi:hypothetical protein